jgi:hypothetical protein
LLTEEPNTEPQEWTASIQGFAQFEVATPAMLIQHQRSKQPQGISRTQADCKQQSFHRQGDGRFVAVPRRSVYLPKGAVKEAIRVTHSFTRPQAGLANVLFRAVLRSYPDSQARRAWFFQCQRTTQPPNPALLGIAGPPFASV